MARMKSWICNVDRVDWIDIEAEDAEEALRLWVRYGMDEWTNYYNPELYEPDHAWEMGESVYYRAYVRNATGKRYQEAAESVAVHPIEPTCDAMEHAWVVTEKTEHTTMRACSICGCTWLTDDAFEDPHDPDGVVYFTKFTVPDDGIEDLRWGPAKWVAPSPTPDTRLSCESLVPPNALAIAVRALGKPKRV